MCGLEQLGDQVLCVCVYIGVQRVIDDDISCISLGAEATVSQWRSLLCRICTNCTVTTLNWLAGPRSVSCSPDTPGNCLGNKVDAANMCVSSNSSSTRSGTIRGSLAGDLVSSSLQSLLHSGASEVGGAGEVGEDSEEGGAGEEGASVTSDDD